MCLQSCGAEEEVYHGTRHLLECKQQEDCNPDFFSLRFFFYQEVSKHFKRKLRLPIENFPS